MKVGYFKEYSKVLEKDMEYKVYGEKGKPAIFFPSQDGRFYQHEDFGMIEVCRPFIEEEKLMVFCVDSIDQETWSAFDQPPRERILKHEAYVKYIMKEILPKTNQDGQKLLFAGVSLGAGHAANFFFRFPPVADCLIALSGMYSTRPFFGDYMDEDIYYNSILDYLGNMTEDKHSELLSHFRESKIAICCGQGAYEELMLQDIYRMKKVLVEKNIPALIDVWGTDVNHDWDWWQKQLAYFLKMFL